MTKIFYPLIALLLTFSSCKDYLDLKGNNTLAVPNTLDDIQALLNNSGNMNGTLTPSMLENWADDYYLPQERYEKLVDVFQRTYLWELGDYNHPNDWSAAYRPVYNANFCMEALRRIGRTEENKNRYDQILGSSFFFRGYYFLQLLWAFAPAYDAATAATDPGIVLKEDTDFNTPSVRTSVQVGYEWVIKDVEQALPLLPDLPIIATQPSKASAYALLARLYLSMRKYEEALIYADEALNLKSDLMDFNKKTDGVDPTQLFSMQLYNKEVVFHSEINTHQGNLSSGAPVDTLLLDTYRIGDLRPSCFFIQSGGYLVFRGNYALNYMFSGLATDELYLIKGECLARAGAVEEAMDVLNHLLKYRFEESKAYSPIIADSKEEALDKVLLERRKSLLFRGLRFQDIKRLNKEGREIAIVRKIGNKTYRLEPEDPRAIVPLPEDLRSFVK